MRDQRNQQMPQLSPMDEIKLVELQCARCFQIEAHDMQTRHGGEDIDQQAGVEPVDIHEVDEPGLSLEEDMLGDF